MVWRTINTRSIQKRMLSKPPVSSVNAQTSNVSNRPPAKINHSSAVGGIRFTPKMIAPKTP
jgi:hypothetical protein